MKESHWDFAPIRNDHEVLRLPLNPSSLLGSYRGNLLLAAAATFFFAPFLLCCGYT